MPVAQRLLLVFGVRKRTVVLQTLINGTLHALQEVLEGPMVGSHVRLSIGRNAQYLLMVWEILPRTLFPLWLSAWWSLS